MTPESVQAIIDQDLQLNSTNGDGSHSLHGDNLRNVQTACPCFYADFMKCQHLNFKGTKGVVSLTRWIEKMESIFNISGCAIKNQVKFATCTLLGAALTWWNGQIRTLDIDLNTLGCLHNINIDRMALVEGCGIDGVDSDYGYALDRVHMSLPEFDLSSFSNKDTAPPPPKAQNVLACALFSKIVKSLGVIFDLSPHQKAVVKCLRAPRAQNFLTVIPIEGLGQNMSALEYRTNLSTS
ncbi:hypothetical protein Tco_0309600 [Tanacetum coccineum]